MSCLIHEFTGVTHLPTRNLKFGTQIGSDRPQIRQIWDFLRSVSVHFGSPSQNILKLILKSPRLVPSGANLTQFVCQICHPRQYLVGKFYRWHQANRYYQFDYLFANSKQYSNTASEQLSPLFADINKAKKSLAFVDFLFSFLYPFFSILLWDWKPDNVYHNYFHWYFFLREDSIDDNTS